MNRITACLLIVAGLLWTAGRASAAETSASPHGAMPPGHPDIG